MNKTWAISSWISFLISVDILWGALRLHEFHNRASARATAQTAFITAWCLVPAARLAGPRSRHGCLYNCSGTRVACGSLGSSPFREGDDEESFRAPQPQRGIQTQGERQEWYSSWLLGTWFFFH